MRARKIESGLLVLIAVLVHAAAVADSGATHTAPLPPVTELRTAQLQPTVQPKARTAAQGESLQFAGLSPTSNARAATLDQAQPENHSTTKDLLALILVGAMLVAYQLFRKHRLLRQQPFSL